MKLQVKRKKSKEKIDKVWIEKWDYKASQKYICIYFNSQCSALKKEKKNGSPLTPSLQSSRLAEITNEINST